MTEKARERKLKCEKCGAEINRINVNFFNREGNDDFYPMYFWEAEEDAVVIDANINWTGYELTEAEQAETIRCPKCGKFPFRSNDIQVEEVVRIICFKAGEQE